MPRVRSRWPHQQHTGRINWGDRLTKGLRHAIVPGLAGRDTIIRDLVSKDCYLSPEPGGGNANSAMGGSEPDIAWYDNYYANARWVLYGPSLIWEFGGEFSVFVRYVPLAEATTPVWGVGGYPYPGWEMISSAGVTSGITQARLWGQFGTWTVESIQFYDSDSGYGQGGVWLTGGFTWRGSAQRYSSYKDGVMGAKEKPFTGAVPWPPLGGGQVGVTIDHWRTIGADSGTSTVAISHVYMWDRELQPQDMLRLSSNPMAIFTAPRPTLWMTGIQDLEIPPEPPEPTVGSPGQQHILGAV